MSAGAAMLIAHVSDFHVFAHAKETALVRDDAAAAARLVVADLAAFRPSLDAVVLTGDLTDGGSAEDYALLHDILAPLRCPVFVVPGNHDRRDTMRAAFGDRLPFEPEGLLHYETRLGDIRILALDTLVEGRGEGRLCAVRRAWVEARLAQPFAGQTIVAMHHPPFLTGTPALDAAALVEGAEALGAMVRAAPSRLRILCGHIHRPVQSTWNGRFAAIGGSPAFQIGLDLSGSAEEPGLVSEPYAYFIHRFDAHGDVAVHTRYVKI